MSLAARYLEEQGIPTVVIGSGRDIVEQCGVPRFLFNDLPLGNPIGKPYDRAMQRQTVALALDVLEKAWAPRTTVQTPFTWDHDAWRVNYMRVDDSNREALRLAGEARRIEREQRRQSGQVRAE